MKGRTTREFACSSDPWPIVEAWAAENGYQLKKEEGPTRLYHKGNWQLMAPACLQFTWSENRAKLEAWVKADIYLLISLLTGKKPEARLDSGGLIATVPRRLAREAVNKLLSRLGQESIT